MDRKRRENLVDLPREVRDGGGFGTAKKLTRRTTNEQLHKIGKYDGFSSGRDENSVSLDPAGACSQQPQGKSTHLKDSAQKVPMLELYSGKVLHPSAKMKLQLFPVNERTCQGLEKDGFNPYLELTLSSRKKISSVLKHIKSKWGSSRMAQGELTLYPYDKLAHLASYNKWTTNSNAITTGDVYAAIGSPSVFRLRYGWVSDEEITTHRMLSTSEPSKDCSEVEGPEKSCCTKVDTCKTGEQIALGTNSFAGPSIEREATNSAVFEKMDPDGPLQSKDGDMKSNCIGPTSMLWDDALTNLSIGGLHSEASLKNRFRNFGTKSNWGSTTLWDDNLTNISIGGLLSEASLQGKINKCEKKSNGSGVGMRVNSPPNISIGGLLSEASSKDRLKDFDRTENMSNAAMQPAPLITNSIDAFLNGQTDPSQGSGPAPLQAHSSILDAEDTCHAFPFQNFSHSTKDSVPKGGSCISATSQMVSQHGAESFKFPKMKEAYGQAQPSRENACQDPEAHMLLSSQVFNQDSSLGLSGIKWTDSLGSFDLGLSSSRRLISPDSISFGSILRNT